VVGVRAGRIENRQPTAASMVPIRDIRVIRGSQIRKIFIFSETLPIFFFCKQREKKGRTMNPTIQPKEGAVCPKREIALAQRTHERKSQ
jgi:hypothetical protein